MTKKAPKVEKEKEVEKIKPREASPEEKESPKRTILVSELDAYISERMREQPKTRGEVDIKVVSPGTDRHRLSLPVELEPHTKKYAFYWVFKHKRAIDRAINVRGWTLINRIYFPELPDHLFTVNGGIEEGDTILAFMPIEKAKKLRREPGLRSAEMMKNLPMEQYKGGDKRFYKAKLGSEEEEARGRSVQEGRDFGEQYEEAGEAFEPSE